MDWDDYKIFSAVARHGSVRGAAADLGVHPSTVTRRLDHFEARLGVRLFIRSRTGLRLSEDGEEVVASLEGVERDLAAIERSLIGRDRKQAGSVKVMLPELVTLSGVLSQFARFDDAFPEVRLALISGDAGDDFTKRDVDVALLATNDPPLDLIGRALGSVRLAVYAKQGYPIQEQDQRLSGLCIEWAGSGPLAECCRTMRESHLADAIVRASCASMAQTLALLQAGFAFAVLPCLVGDSQSDLQRIPSVASAEGPELWLLTAPELRNRVRVRVFVDFLVDLFAESPHLLSGRL